MITFPSTAMIPDEDRASLQGVAIHIVGAMISKGGTLIFSSGMECSNPGCSSLDDGIAQ